MSCDKLVILDAGSQYVKIIQRRVNELHVCSDIKPVDTSATAIREAGYKAIIISGGPISVQNTDYCHVDPNIFSLGIPVLGVCYGLQSMNFSLGGTLDWKSTRQDGQFEIKVDASCSLFTGLSGCEKVLFTHGESVGKVADGFKVVAESGNVIAAIADEKRHFYGVQFHPEIDLTVNGTKIYQNFIVGIAGMARNYCGKDVEEMCIEEIRKCGEDAKVFVHVDGGMDSIALAVLCNKALSPSQVMAFYIDSGYLRKNESKVVIELLKEAGINARLVKASHDFSNNVIELVEHRKDGRTTRRHRSSHLCQSHNPEEKRMIISDTFMQLIDAEIHKLGFNSDKCFIAQDSSYLSLVESASDLASYRATVIKTHHNDSNLSKVLRKSGRLIEPFCNLHKDEIRKLGSKLNLPEAILTRHPFPAPGLAIRILCAEEPFINPDFTETQTIIRLMVRFSHSLKAPHVLLKRVLAATSEQEQEKLKEYSSKLTLRATLLPIRSVGAQGDTRSYTYVAGLSSSATSVDWNILMYFAKLIPRICHNINRVVYIFGGEVTESLLDVTPTFLAEPALGTIRQCDLVAHRILEENSLLSKISQMPVVLVPLHFDRDMAKQPPSCQRSVVLRPFITKDYMAGVPVTPGVEIPEAILLEMVEQLENVTGISRVMLDLTPKPPATIEWE